MGFLLFMKILKYLLILVILIQSCSSIKSSGDTRRINLGVITFKRYDIITEKSALEGTLGFQVGLEEFMSMGMDSIEKKEFLANPAHNEMTVSSKFDSLEFDFVIKNEHYWHPYDPRHLSLLDKMTRVDRDSLYQCKNISQEDDKSCNKKSKISFLNENEYVVKYLFDERKMILGYDCFKIVVVKPNRDYVPLNIEMYVTEAIKLNYHPIFNMKSLNDRYFILELKRYVGKDEDVRVEFKAESIDLNYD